MPLYETDKDHLPIMGWYWVSLETLTWQFTSAHLLSAFPSSA